jgi:hypothetical protein
LAAAALNGSLLEAPLMIAVRMDDMRASLIGSPVLQVTRKVSFTLLSGVVTFACARRWVQREV